MRSNARPPTRKLPQWVSGRDRFYERHGAFSGFPNSIWMNVCSVPSGRRRGKRGEVAVCRLLVGSSVRPTNDIPPSEPDQKATHHYYRRKGEWGGDPPTYTPWQAALRILVALSSPFWSSFLALLWRRASLPLTFNPVTDISSFPFSRILSRSGLSGK